ncbi:hypothetical protein AB1Y20_021956 [Prymnesium parvum]|uniref:Uncharacterized protein n=1 Tax=Prymnesium parvum TaxID=97485 RepID=A0AB34JFP9_PRYPA|mmetsp:Transcript_26262/g.46081  ORF Transcript_26262/g.46081 Transcript_26262/m.46081 type:complete len:142 (-) Transcript_26262:148-573(-)
MLALLLLSAASPRLSSTGFRAIVTSRRPVLCYAAALVLPAPPAAASLGYVDNAGVKSYSQVQRAWEKSAEMSQRDILMAARGAGKVDDPTRESAKSRKRRAMAACRDATYRSQGGAADEASCNARVLSGDLQFMLDVLDAH